MGGYNLIKCNRLRCTMHRDKKAKRISEFYWAQVFPSKYRAPALPDLALPSVTAHTLEKISKTRNLESRPADEEDYSVDTRSHVFSRISFDI